MLNVLLLILNLIAICSVNNAYANEEDPKIESLCKKSSVDPIALHNINDDYINNRFYDSKINCINYRKILRLRFII